LYLDLISLWFVVELDSLYALMDNVAFIRWMCCRVLRRVLGLDVLHALMDNIAFLNHNDIAGYVVDVASHKHYNESPY
jgi:hypothetical protein